MASRKRERPKPYSVDGIAPVIGDAGGEGDVTRLEFAGGLYGAIEHSGPYETIDQAYRSVADGIRRSGRFAFLDGPPVQIFRRWSTGGDPTENLTEVYFPVEKT